MINVIMFMNKENTTQLERKKKIQHNVLRKIKRRNPVHRGV